jgi:hypothetical protein
VAHVGKRYLRHEYSAVDEAGNEVLLWQGTEAGAGKWMLAMPLRVSKPLTPPAAGAFRLGQAVVLNDDAANVTDFFLSRVQKVEGVTPLTTGELYGFIARGPKAAFAVRWNGTSITFYGISPPLQKDLAKTFR